MDGTVFFLGLLRIIPENSLRLAQVSKTCIEIFDAIGAMSWRLDKHCFLTTGLT